MADEPVTVGTGACRYQALPAWGELPAGWALREAVGVAADSGDRVFVFCRSEHPVVVFARDGSFLRAWGEGMFRRPHGIYVGPDDSVYCTDDQGHTVRRFTPEGRLLQVFGSGQPSETGVVNSDYRTLRQPAGPFNQPTSVVLAPNGDLFVADGYGNCRVHRFAPDGRLLDSWGEPGHGPGQFHLVHGLGIDADGLLYVADRENRRIQRFTQAGQYVDSWPADRPCLCVRGADGRFYVTELGYRAGMSLALGPAAPGAAGGSVTVRDAGGAVLARWGGGADPARPGDFYAPHGIAVDSHGDLYVGEVRPAPAEGCPPPPPEAPVLRKFVRL